MNRNLGKPVTMQNQMQFNTNMYNNFQQAYTPETPLIDAQDYTNRKQILHNNIGEKVQNERVVEYRIMIHSKDRDIKKFPSPFKMQVTFGNSNVEPHLDEHFTNVKYVSLNRIWVPKTLAVDTSNIDLSSGIHDILPENSVLITPYTHDYSIYNLGIKPYLLLKVKEIANKYFSGTDSDLIGDSFVLIFDQRAGDRYIFKPTRSTVVYQNSLLKNLNMFTLNLVDDEGSDLNIVDKNGKKIIGQNISSDVPYDFNSYVETFKDINSNVEYTGNTMQVVYDFTIGVIENEINTVTSYNKF